MRKNIQEWKIQTFSRKEKKKKTEGNYKHSIYNKGYTARYFIFFLRQRNIVPDKKQEIQEEMKIIKVVKHTIGIGDKHINT